MLLLESDMKFFEPEREVLGEEALPIDLHRCAIIYLSLSQAVHPSDPVGKTPTEKALLLSK